MIGEKIPEQSIRVGRLDRKNRWFFDPASYQILWMGEGVSEFRVDHLASPVYPNTIAFLSPGKQVEIRLLCHPPPRGWILSFPEHLFLSKALENLNIQNLYLLNGNGKVPSMVLSPKIGERVNALVEMIAELNGSQIPNRENAADSLLNTLLIYCDSRCNLKVDKNNNPNEVNIVRRYKQLVSEHFHEAHLVNWYAEKMHLSPKYLNQVIKRVMKTSAKSIIQEQLLIKACRDLKFSGESIKEIANKLGFSEPEHFSHFFKKATGQSPSYYREL